MSRKITQENDPDWRPLYVAEGAEFTWKPGPTPDYIRLKTRIVYFINCHVNPNYIYLFRSQMESLRRTGLIQGTSSVLYIISSGTAGDQAMLAAELRRIWGDLPNLRHEHGEENAFEYPGIRKVWELGREDQDAYILYFHARGLSRIKLGRFRRNRQPAERRLFKRVVSEWRMNLNWLEHIPSAEKVGLTCGGNGWVWYNFWWARASYVKHLEEPVKTDRRHYYEDWLGRFLPDASGGYAVTLDKCLAVAHSRIFKKFNLGSDYRPDDGSTYLGLPWGGLKIFVRRFVNFVAQRGKSP
jgi:hypothetical protein